jgi:predicted ATPase
MEGNMAMTLTRLELSNLTVIEAANIEFAPGINVFIGENGTGKSHILKAIYALLQAAGGRPATSSEAAQNLKERLAGIFRPDDGQVGRLVRVGASVCTLWLHGDADEDETYCTVSESSDISVTEHHWTDGPRALFVPSRDVLAMYEGFMAAYLDRELSFDETYYDMCIALSRAPLRGEARAAAEELARSLQDLFEGAVKLQGERFYINIGDGDREAHLVAEGLRKLAAISHLIHNGSIRAGSVLIWDEPEAGLNPRLVESVARLLRALAAAGVQIFLATHDYLLSQHLSLAVEYGMESRGQIAFFSFHHEQPTDPVEVEHGPTLVEIMHNPILAAYAQHYEYERELFRGELEENVP